MVYLALPLSLIQLSTSLPSELRPRADNPDDCEVEDPASPLAGPTSNGEAGLGIEFESSKVVLSSPDCSKADTNDAKAKVIGERTGDNWQLTADTIEDAAGRLYAEYILDGTKINIGSGTAGAAAAAVSSDLVREIHVSLCPTTCTPTLLVVKLAFKHWLKHWRLVHTTIRVG